MKDEKKKNTLSTVAGFLPLYIHVELYNIFSAKLHRTRVVSVFLVCNYDLLGVIQKEGKKGKSTFNVACVLMVSALL